MSTFLFVLLLGAIALLIPTAYAGKIGAPWAPTRRKAIDSVFEQIEVGEGDLVVDLGAGDAKVLLAASRRGARAVGYELSPIMWVVAFVRTMHRKGISVRYKNFFKARLPKRTTVLFTFLMPENMDTVRSYIQSQNVEELRYVVVYAFKFDDVDAIATIREPQCAPMFVYRAEDVKG